MLEREKERIKEREAVSLSGYEMDIKMREEFAHRQYHGPVVIKPSDREWEYSRQGKILWYLNPFLYPDTPLQDWYVFAHDIRTHSGKHIHQGGLAIFVLEGKGYTIIDGERYDWEEGDLILLPLKPGGVEHQHFNAEPGKPCRWLAFINLYAAVYWLASGMKQVVNSPEYKG